MCAGPSLLRQAATAKALVETHTTRRPKWYNRWHENYHGFGRTPCHPERHTGKGEYHAQNTSQCGMEGRPDRNRTCSSAGSFDSEKRAAGSTVRTRSSHLKA